MDASFFIARRLRFKGKMAMVSIAVSFLVMIIAVSVSSGFRNEIRKGLSSLAGDIQLMSPDMNITDENLPIERTPRYLSYIEDIDGVDSVIPVVYRAGIVKSGDEIHGVLFKGLPDGTDASVKDSSALSVVVPSRLAEMLGIGEGDRMLTYFVGESVKARQFTVASVYEPMVQTDDKLVVYAKLGDMQRINGWSDDQVSCMEIILDRRYDDEYSIEAMNDMIGTMVYACSSEDEEPVIAVSSVAKYPQLYDWLGLIDFNVLFILLLMTVVAGFNMISGLLIMLFENISTIGLLKALGMTDRAICTVFLSSSAVHVLKGMAIGNALAFVFCLLQGTTHVLRLNPENYFVSYVPVHVDIGMILTADVVAFAAIMILLLLPCIFISKVDPAQTVRVK